MFWQFGPAVRPWKTVLFAESIYERKQQLLVMAVTFIAQGCLEVFGKTSVH